MSGGRGVDRTAGMKEQIEEKLRQQRYVAQVEPHPLLRLAARGEHASSGSVGSHVT